jgi:hypothetical protein
MYKYLVTVTCKKLQHNVSKVYETDVAAIDDVFNTFIPVVKKLKNAVLTTKSISLHTAIFKAGQTLFTLKVIRKK